MKIFAALSVLALLLGSGEAYAKGPQRIVSAGGDITEIINALGAGDRVVGVDSTSNFPPEMAEKEQIGYIRNLAAEGILSLQPDILIAAHDAGPPSVVAQLRAAGLKVELAPQGDSVAGVQEKIRFVGNILEMPEKAAVLAQKLEEQMAASVEIANANKERPRVIFVLNIADGAPLVGGRGTSAGSVIALAGGVNAADGFEGYKPMSQEAIITAEPDILLMMSQTVDRLGSVDVILSRPEFQLTSAGENRRYVAMEGVLLFGFGPRLPQAVRDLAMALQQKGN